MSSHSVGLRGRAFITVSAVSLLAGCGTDAVDRVSAPLAPGTPPLSIVTAASFAIGPLSITGIEQHFPDGRWQFRNATLVGPVTGDITGSALVTLNLNSDQFVGSGPAWGTVSITTNTGQTWQGSLTGYFLTGLPDQPGIQLFSHVVLHAPSSQTLRAECDETTAISETLVCTVDVAAGQAFSGMNATSSISSTAANKTAINGAVTNSVPGVPATSFQSANRCHFWGWPNVTQFTGDVSGTVTFEERVNAPCNFSDNVASGPISGDNITWNGRTGSISGQWTTNCNPDASQPLGLSCDGVMNARGSGGLEGVHFKFNWGPGWFPFPYSGTASTD
jgi:hypothetical protein